MRFFQATFSTLFERSPPLLFFFQTHTHTHTFGYELDISPLADIIWGGYELDINPLADIYVGILSKREDSHSDS